MAAHDLASMMDILQEISLPANALQARCLTCQEPKNLLKRSIKAFEILKGHLKRKLMIEFILMHLRIFISLKTIELFAFFVKSCLT